MVAPETLLDEALEQNLAQILKPYPVVLAYLFGSATHGQTTPFSDVDIALVLDEASAEQPDRLHLELEIEDEIVIQCGLSNADVRVINTAPLVVRGEVVTHGRRLFARDDATRIEFETRTRAEYFDFLPAAEFYQQAFFENVRQRGLDGQHPKIKRIAS